MRPDPIHIKDLLPKERYEELVSYLKGKDRSTLDWSDGFGRFHISNDPFLDKLAEELTPIAREVFGSSTLLPSYTLGSIYAGSQAQLWKHRDDNACTYTLDLCVWSNTPWDLWVEGKPYTAVENEAVAFWGNDQEHWREAFPDPANNEVAVIFFHFVEPDHWYFVHGPQYLQVIRAGK